MGHANVKSSKSIAEEPSSSVDPPVVDPEPIFGSPLEKTHGFPASMTNEDTHEEKRSKRISIGSPIKTPSPVLPPKQTKDDNDQTEEPEVRKIPFVFRWNYGGNDVYLAGDFNNWEQNIPLSKSQGDFTAIVDLPEGEYQYKFIVDGQWVHDPEEENIDNTLGSRNNVLKVTQKDMQAYDSQDFLSPYPDGMDSSSPPGNYTQDIPSYKGATVGLPPQLPSVLQNTILNQEPLLENDPIVLSKPDPVVLNHLYALSVKDHVLVLAATHRYKDKFVTTLMYKPV